MADVPPAPGFQLEVLVSTKALWMISVVCFVLGDMFIIGTFIKWRVDGFNFDQVLMHGIGALFLAGAGCENSRY